MKYIVIASTEYGEQVFTRTSSLEHAEKHALEFAREGYFPEIYELGNVVNSKAVEDFLNSEYNN